MSMGRAADPGPMVRVPLHIIQSVLDLVEMLRRGSIYEGPVIADTIESILKPYDDQDAAQLDEIARLGT